MGVLGQEAVGDRAVRLPLPWQIGATAHKFLRGECQGTSLAPNATEHRRGRIYSIKGIGVAYGGLIWVVYIYLQAPLQFPPSDQHRRPQLQFKRIQANTHKPPLYYILHTSQNVCHRRSSRIFVRDPFIPLDLASGNHGC